MNKFSMAFLMALSFGAQADWTLGMDLGDEYVYPLDDFLATFPTLPECQEYGIRAAKIAQRNRVHWDSVSCVESTPEGDALDGGRIYQHGHAWELQ